MSTRNCVQQNSLRGYKCSVNSCLRCTRQLVVVYGSCLGVNPCEGASVIPSEQKNFGRYGETGSEPDWLLWRQSRGVQTGLSPLLGHSDHAFGRNCCWIFAIVAVDSSSGAFSGAGLGWVCSRRDDLQGGGVDPLMSLGCVWQKVGVPPALRRDCVQRSTFLFSCSDQGFRFTTRPKMSLTFNKVGDDWQTTLPIQQRRENRPSKWWTKHLFRSVQANLFHDFLLFTRVDLFRIYTNTILVRRIHKLFENHICTSCISIEFAHKVQQNFVNGTGMSSAQGNRMASLLGKVWRRYSQTHSKRLENKMSQPATNCARIAICKDTRFSSRNKNTKTIKHFEKKKKKLDRKK